MCTYEEEDGDEDEDVYNQVDSKQDDDFATVLAPFHVFIYCRHPLNSPEDISPVKHCNLFCDPIVNECPTITFALVPSRSSGISII